MKDFPDYLLNGYKNFMSGRYAGERDRYRTLADSGQKPQTLFIACCDSRSAPETIFDCGPGELFVMRNVANMVPPFEPDGQYHATSAAIEYAVQVLKVKDIVVMGHGRCGGIQAALDPNFESLSPGDFIGKWMNLVKSAAEQIQNAPRTLTGWNLRASNMPSEKGKSIRSSPPKKFSPSSVQPTPIMP